MARTIATHTPAGRGEHPGFRRPRLAEPVTLPAARPPVDYYSAIAGEPPDQHGYRAALTEQGESLVRVTPEHRSRTVTGRLPARLG